MAAVPLPRSTPRAEGVSAAGLERFLDAIAAHRAIELHSLLVLRHGRVIAEGWWAPHRPGDRRQLYSLSKTFTATALGFALAEGRLTLGDRVVDHVPDLAGAAGPRARAITVEHLARMATGHRTDTLDAMRERDPAEPVRGFLGLEPEAEPGSVFLYNNGATYTLGAVLQACTGHSLTGFLQPRLFDPLGIAPPYWDRMGGPRQIGFAGLHLATEDVAKVALLHAQDGRWQGAQVLPAGWVATASRAHTPTPDEPEPDWRRGYGYQLWRSRHGYRADGAFGQFALVLPDDQAVVAITAETEQMQALLDAVWAHLVPTLGGPGSAAEDEALAARLTAPTLPAGGAGTQPGDQWLTVTAVDPDADGWVVTVDTGGHRATVPCGPGSWRRSTVPLAPDRVLVVEAQGRWAGDTFVADLVLVQSPHRLTLRYTPASAASTVRWRTVPLVGPPLAGLAAPPVVR